MSLAEPLLRELEAEGVATRKVLERMPEDKFAWAPHEKSMTLGKLASHVADLPSWVAYTIEHDELTPGPENAVPEGLKNAGELVAHFDKQMAGAKTSLQNASDETLMGHWQMKMGDVVLIDLPRVEVLRRWVLNHSVHHRAQLTVYLRLNDVPVPAVYGASADEQDF